MSRLIKKSIALPAGVTITERGELFMVKGPKGELYDRYRAGRSS